MEKVNLSIINQARELGTIRLVGWKRKQNNMISSQEQNWLFGKEYFFSTYTQEKRRDKREIDRRKNQDDIREKYQVEIKQFLRCYRQIAEVLKQFIPNYSAVIYDGFRLEYSIKRLFKYHLVINDIDNQDYSDHDFDKILDIDAYWRREIESIEGCNLDDMLRNPAVRKASILFNLYYKIKDTLTGWYIRRLIFNRNSLDDTTLVFDEFNHTRNLKKICYMIKCDFNSKIKIAEYRDLFRLFKISSQLLQKAIYATLNEKGRKDAWDILRRTFWHKIDSERRRTREKFFNFTGLVLKDLAYHYSILGLQEGTSKKEIKKKYRKKAKECHPDKIGGDGKKFIELTDSYNILMNNT